MASNPHPRALVVMAKRPQAGTVKTRLAPRLGEERAAELYRAMLLDVVYAADIPDSQCFLFVHPPTEKGWFSARIPSQWKIHAQQGEDLAHRMVHTFDTLLGAGHRSVIMRNSDSPTLPGSHLAQAYETLERDEADVVLGPDLGGGYALVGLAQPAPFLFLDVSMSTEGMQQATTRRAERAGLRVHHLEPWLDIDEPADLDHLRAQLEAPEHALRAPRTLDWLVRHPHPRSAP